MAPIPLWKMGQQLRYREAGTPGFSVVGGLVGSPQNLAPEAGLRTGASLSSSALAALASRSHGNRSHTVVGGGGTPESSHLD